MKIKHVFLNVSMAAMLILTCLIVSNAGAVTYNSDQTISTPTLWQDETVYMNGNITITSSLTMDNVILVMGVNGSWIKAQPGSTLHIKDCYFTTANSSIRYSIFVEDSVDFTLENNTIENFGSKDPERLRTATYPSNEYEEYNRYLYVLEQYTNKVSVSGNDGLEIKSPAYKFANNSFSNYTHIRLFAEDNVVENNTFQNMSHEGLAFMKYTNNSVVRYNTFKNALRMNREIFGLRYYPSSYNHEIHHNHFEWLPWSMMMGNIPAYESGAPSWYGGQYYNIHHNTFTKVLMAMDMNVNSAHIHHNNVTNIYSRAITIAGRWHTIENNTLTNLDFQGEVDDIITMDYYWEAWNREGHCAIPNIAYWMFGFYCTRYFIRLAGRFLDSEVKYNYMANSPPYSFGIDMDADRKLRVDITKNTFENIETYFPPDFTIREDYTGHVALADVDPISGGGIILENADYINIRENVFKNVLHGITTTGPDGLGNAGNFTIENNYLQGVKTLSWNEDRRNGNYWSGNYSVVKDGMGIGTGLDWWTTHGIKIQPEYYGDSVQVIRNNTIYTYKYPLVIDYLRRVEPNTLYPMGKKTAQVYDNLVLNYDQIKQIPDGINTIQMHSNILRPECPGPFKVASEGTHLVTVYVDNYFMPEESFIDQYSNDTVLNWNSAGFTDPRLSIDYSTDSGSSWHAIPGNKSLAHINSSSQNMWFNVTTSAKVSTDPSYYYPSNVTLTYDKNTAPHLYPMTDFVAEKNQIAYLDVNAVDQDLDSLTYLWECLDGPVNGLVIVNNTMSNASFIPNSSGVYRFQVKASDAYTSRTGLVNVTAGNLGPAAFISAPKAVFKGERVNLTSTSTDPNNDPLLHDWYLVEGPEVHIVDNTTAKPYFIPAKGGSYKLGLKVSDGEVWSMPYEAVVNVYSRPPTANLTVPAGNITVGTGAVFSANGSADVDGVVSFYYFDFGDGTNSDWISQPWTTHFYYIPGNFTVTLKVRDEDFNVSEAASAPVVVLPVRHPPSASFVVTPAEKLAGSELSFRSTSEDLDGYLVSWTWDLGDGSEASGEQVKHAYAEPGEYNVTLAIVDDHGLEASITEAVLVKAKTLYPPEITDHYPDVDEPVIYLGGSEEFGITIQQAEPSPLTITWTVDGDVVDDNVTFIEYSPSATGSYEILVSVSDGIFDPVEQAWTLKVIEEPIEKPTLGELWAENKNDTTDTDADGLPDWWEEYYDLDPEDGTDATDELKEKFEEERDTYAPPDKKDDKSYTWFVVLGAVIIILLIAAICIGLFFLMKGKKKKDDAPEEEKEKKEPEALTPEVEQAPVVQQPVQAAAMGPASGQPLEQMAPEDAPLTPVGPAAEGQAPGDVEDEEFLQEEPGAVEEELQMDAEPEDLAGGPEEEEVLDDLDDLDELDDMFEM